ncbi:MAG: translation elongation factor Ts [Parachlamydiales bacterium]|jgi:elongation factor Ts
MSAAVTPALIKELRERTGVGMGSCKEALVASNGSIDEAIEWLRKKGMASAVKKEGRATNEGTIVSAREGNSVAILEANAETDFVVRNERFQEFVKHTAQDAAKNHVTSLETLMALPYSKDNSLTVDQQRATLIQAIGENIQIRRLHLFSLDNNASVGVYSHQNGKLLTAVVIQGSAGEDDLAREIAMHTAAAAPEFLKPEEVPADVIQKEREIAASQMQGKPANIVDKIVEGKLNAYYDAICLLRQKFIKDDSKTIQQLVEERAKQTGKPLQVSAFIRWNVGG